MPVPSLRISVCILPIFLLCSEALAGDNDFRFELASTDHRVGSAVLELRLTDLRTSIPVEGAVVFATRLDMEPDGMETMTSPVTLLPAELPGHYRLASNLTMAGNWRLSIAAKVQGELETVTARIELEARP